MYKLTLKDEGFGEQTGLETLLVEAGAPSNNIHARVAKDVI
jgi:hypothetical protein